MRNLLMVSIATVALAACGPRANDAASDAGNIASAPMTDNVVVPADEPMGNGTADASLSGATPADTFVLQAAASDLFEITSGKMAVEKATDPALKKFGQQMVEAHTATTRGLKAALATDNIGSSPPAALDTSHQGLIDQLSAAGGASFNQLYRRQQIDSHTKALTLMQGYAVSGDAPALKAFAVKTAPTVKMHLDMIGG